ncbi:hypothetical protein C8F01DRAFT_1253803 [Mycena amicta]|nr:hypothetical protein C8F01DRAFT_1253803 [Mycena amicta]
MRSLVHSRYPARSARSEYRGHVDIPGGQAAYVNWGRRTEAGEPVTSDTIFAVGSDSKQLLSASLGILMQDFEHLGPRRLPSTLTQLNWNTKAKDVLLGAFPIMADVILPTIPHAQAPQRQFWEYNNQTLSGVCNDSWIPYRHFVEQRVFQPLEMTSSTMHPDVANAAGRFSQPEARSINVVFHSSLPNTAPSSSQVIRVKTMLNGGVDKLGNHTIVPQSTFNLATGFGTTVAPGCGSRIDIYTTDLLCNIENLAGTYPNSGPAQANNTSVSCKAVIKDFRLVDAAGRPASQAASRLVAAWPRFWGPTRVSPLGDGDGSYAFQMTNLCTPWVREEFDAVLGPDAGVAGTICHRLRDLSSDDG